MEYPVFTYKTDAMKKLQQLAARGGYTRYSSGVIETKHIEKLLAKFEDRYRIHATKQMRYRAKQRGDANTEIVLFLEKDHIHFWLMVSPGESLVTELETLHELTDKKHRLVVTGYELVRVQRPEKVRWTWRMCKANYAEFEQRISDACKHQNLDHIRQIQYSLERMPVFSEMRQQAFALHKFLQNTYKRHFDHPYEVELKKNFHGRYKAASTKSAIEIGRKARRVKETARQALIRELASWGMSEEEFKNEYYAYQHQVKSCQFEVLKFQKLICDGVTDFYGDLDAAKAALNQAEGAFHHFKSTWESELKVLGLES